MRIPSRVLQFRHSLRDPNFGVIPNPDGNFYFRGGGEGIRI